MIEFFSLRLPSSQLAKFQDFGLSRDQGSLAIFTKAISDYPGYSCTASKRGEGANKRRLLGMVKISKPELRLRHDFGAHKTSAVALVLINAVLCVAGIALAIFSSAASAEEARGVAGEQGGDDVKELMQRMGVGALLLGLLGLAGVLRWNNLLFLYFVTVALLMVLGFWASCMVSGWCAPPSSGVGLPAPAPAAPAASDSARR
jgi:hypothetical protein